MPERAIGGRTIAWREAGAGAPALLLHCALGHSGAFAELMAGLDDLLAMRALDLPGHGGTTYDPTLDVQDQAVADGLALLADRGPAHLIGHSFGGTAALRLGLEAPRHVTSLTLIEPVQYSLLADAGDPAFAREVAAQDAFHAAMAAGDRRAAAELFLSRWGGRRGLAAMSPRQVEYTLARLPLIVASEPALQGAGTPRVHLADLARLTCPTLLLAGADSPAMVHAILDLIAAEIPGSCRLKVPGAGHMVPITHADAVSGALREFLALQHA